MPIIFFDVGWLTLVWLLVSLNCSDGEFASAVKRTMLG